MDASAQKTDGQSTVDAVKQQGSQAANDVMETAKQQVSQIGDQATDQVLSLISEAKGQLRERAEAQVAQAAEGLNRLQEQTQALADGRVDDAGALADYARQAAERMSDLGQRIDTRGLDGLLQDVQRFARRRPGTFLLATLVAGIAVGRIVRAQAAGDSSSLPASSPESSHAVANTAPPLVAHQSELHNAPTMASLGDAVRQIEP
jgi:X-X-X-Leu-X-X-Gly heptad repeat protein